VQSVTAWFIIYFYWIYFDEWHRQQHKFLGPAEESKSKIKFVAKKSNNLWYHWKDESFIYTWENKRAQLKWQSRVAS